MNGQDDLELTVHQQKNNSLDLQQISELWELNYNNIDYKIVHVKQQTKGNGFYLNIRAIPLFYWEFDKSIIHENHDGSHTANSAFQTMFANSGYNFVLVDFSPSVEIEGFGKGSTRLELFKRLLDRYNYEFLVDGKTVYMYHLVGNDTNFMYKYKLNASNISRSTDATAYFTHIKGFGDMEEGEEDYYNNAKLKREYTSPLVDVVGKWEGKPVLDGRVTQQSTLDEMMHKAVEESLAITVEGTLHDVRQMGYEIAVPLKGDRIFLMDERINLDQEIRVQAVKTTYDERDRITGCEVTFGSQSIRKRYKASINSLSENFQDLITGKLKLPIISLEQIGMDMIKNIHDASSEIVFGDFGMQAISKTNPNNVFGVNSEGWYISQDGGATPRTIATAQGIYADALFAGTLWLTNEMNIESADGYLNVTGSRFVMRSKNNSKNAVEITPDGITIYGFDGREFIVDGIMRGRRAAQIQPFKTDGYLGPNGGSPIWFDGMSWRFPGTMGFEEIYRVDDEYLGRFLDFRVSMGIADYSEANSTTIQVRFRNWDNEIVGSGTYTVEKNKDPLRQETIRVDLQAMFGSIPDYRTTVLYCQVRVSGNSNVEGIFRLNRGEFHG
ncbi:phage tail spike protein [Salinicoccus albus]|uniref:phage tail spike protein n=1 Tax=Salinicoccus albus TaxID=418756 RepID=UPI000478429D|nr:phage tail spike protein [Salinicoccus albus]